MNWHQTVSHISPHVFKIESPSGHGTGFLCFLNETKTLIGVATAKHVVEEENKWQQPIRISNYQLEYSKLLTTTDRVILEDTSRDSALILFDPSDLKLPEDLVPLIPVGRILKIGVEVGWVGFPAVEPNTLCFFSGNISANIRGDSAYLIDGVAINGVSGGPVFDKGPNGVPKIIGIVTAYMANRTSRDTLPGLAVAQDVRHIHETVSNLKSLEEAADKQKELEVELQQPKVEPPDPQLPLPGTSSAPDDSDPSNLLSSSADA